MGQTCRFAWKRGSASPPIWKFLSAIGIKPETSVKDVCAFVERVYVAKDLAHFTGDENFVRCDDCQKGFSKLRSSIGGLYQWRLNARQDAGDKARLRREANFAFRQAFALCPISPEAIFRYSQLLEKDGRVDDAILIVRTARKLDPTNDQISALQRTLETRKSKAAAGAE